MADQGRDLLLPVFLQNVVPGGDSLGLLEVGLENLGTPRVMFFLWLACQRPLWNGRVPCEAWAADASCTLCGQAVETMRPLLMHCSFSRSLWYEVLYWIQSTAQPLSTGADSVDWWRMVSISTHVAAHEGTQR